MTPDVLTSPALAPFAHGFFTRRGGVSAGVYDSLNCGPGSADDPDAVAENRDRVRITLGAARLVNAHQVHSADAVTITGSEGTAKPEADGLVTDRPGLALAVLTADCQPVLFADPDARVIGAAHAGWKGALSGVLEATLSAMEGLGARRQKIRAVIGPSISGPNYEVGPEFRDRFLADSPDNHRFFTPGRGDRFQFDLPAYGLARLTAAGIPEPIWIGACTYADPTRFFSYRYATHQGHADYGRLIAAISLPPAP